MSKYFKNLWRLALSEIKSHPTNYILLAAVLILALFVRVYRVDELLNFYYDQGRDALVIWRFWHEGRPFLVGPVTGLAGIFLGPFYYYLIAPFYLIGGGNPVFPAAFLAFLSTVAIFLLYLLGYRLHSRQVGIFAAIIGAFSYRVVLAGRWLANPTPILLTSLLLLLSMWMIAVGKSKRWWIATSILIGISLQLEAASAVFYLPMIIVFAIWLTLREVGCVGKRTNLPDKKTLLISSFFFLITLVPQVVFNFRHENILFNNFKRVLVEERSFRPTTNIIWEKRTEFFWNVFRNKIFPEESTIAAIIITLLIFILIVSRYKQKKLILPLFGIFLITPMVGLLLFQGNYGNIYDYYLTGYYLPFVLLFAIALGEVWRKKVGVWLVLLFFLIFLTQNGLSLKNYFSSGIGGPTAIALGNELQAVEWIFEDAKEKGEFNLDVYVPPVIPYSYDYLFLWQGTLRQAQGKPGCDKKLCGLKLEGQVPLLYTLYEIDPPHPWRLEAWLERQKGIGEVIEEAEFEGITVQRRARITFSD